MPGKKIKKSEKPDPLKTGFLVRALDQEVIELIEAALKRKIFPNRNKLINECVRNWLPIVTQKNNPEQGMKDIFQNEMVKYTKPLRKDLDVVKEFLLTMLALQGVNEKGIGYLIHQVDHLRNGQAAIPNLPDAAIEAGQYDKLPERLEKEKNIALKTIIEEE